MCGRIVEPWDVNSKILRLNQSEDKKKSSLYFAKRIEAHAKYESQNCAHSVHVSSRVWFREHSFLEVQAIKAELLLVIFTKVVK